MNVIERRTSSRLRGEDKAAALLIALGVDLSAEVLKHFDEEEIARLMLAVARTGKMGPEVKTQIITDAYHLSQAHNAILIGGLDYARKVLARTLGEAQSEELIERISSQKNSSFEFLRKADPQQVATFLRDEHPQTIAVVLSNLDSKQAAQILATLDPGLRAEVAARIASMERISPQVIAQLEYGLERKLAGILDQEDLAASGGINALVRMLNQVDRGTEKSILDHLSEADPQLAEELRARLFTFDDIIKLDDRSLQRVLRDVNKQDLALALKGTTDEVRNAIFRNMSTRAAEMIKEEMDVAGPVRMKAVYEAQRRIVDVIRALEAAEEIVVMRGGQDEFV